MRDSTAITKKACAYKFDWLSDKNYLESKHFKLNETGVIAAMISEGLEPNDFHFMHYVHCPDTGVDCLGYGEVMLKVHVVPRKKQKNDWHEG